MVHDFIIVCVDEAYDIVNLILNILMKMAL